MNVIATVLVVGLSAVAFSAYSADEDFYAKLAQAGRAEVAAGKLANMKATTDPVRDFGLTMVKDHGAANRKLEDLAKSKGIELPKTPGDQHRADYKALQSAVGGRFDKTYLDGQVKAHEEAVQLLKSEISSGQDADAKKLAEELLPMDEAHLKEIYRLSGQSEKAAAMP
jgi:putative membrane protein